MDATRMNSGSDNSSDIIWWARRVKRVSDGIPRLGGGREAVAGGRGVGLDVVVVFDPDGARGSGGWRRWGWWRRRRSEGRAASGKHPRSQRERLLPLLSLWPLPPLPVLREVEIEEEDKILVCVPAECCQGYSDLQRNDDKYPCSETGYRVPLKCVRIKDGTEEASRIRTQRSLLYLQEEHASGVQKRLLTTRSNYKWRKLLAESSKLENEEENYITYRSCVPVDSNEKLSVLGFEVIILGLLLISGSVVYLRQKRTAIMSGVAPMRVSTSSPRF
ncbi:hypothetical protein MUK42_24518 [Musa troglodytarum]|uniref:Uncharacterized protein n=1 Tax=Musa troglodytarum TaxID=320322 RepID=A0A9E7ER74_9LILI|nr:hypothetical protein MUK42_24518 [Musa troglodytarum]